ncbi:MAG: hypothetical protein IKK14_05865 [Oscillospiraceae bacterium]|nr:hypothetical protein [Oscillospiraceae bacterium]
MERKIKVTGIQKLVPKDVNRSPVYKIHYNYEDNKIDGVGADNVFVTEAFIQRYNPVKNQEYLAAVYFDNDYRTHFAAMFVEG